MEDPIKKTESISTCKNIHLLNLADCVKQTPKKFEIAHFWVHSLANDAFSSPKADRRIETLHQFKNT